MLNPQRSATQHGTNPVRFVCEEVWPMRIVVHNRNVH